MDRYFFLNERLSKKTLSLVYLSIDRLMEFQSGSSPVDRVVSESTKQFGSNLVDMLIYFPTIMYNVLDGFCFR